MENENQWNGLTLPLLINKHSINKAHLAAEMNMPVGTFKNKLSVNQPMYKFSEAEEKALIAILRDMANDIEIVARSHFNKTTETFVKK